MLCTYLLLFNCQGSIALFRVLRRKLRYYITFFSVCQYLFEKFFKFFSWFLTSGFLRDSRAFCTQLAYYITLHPLCQYLFEKFFKSFFQTLHHLPGRQGCVLYIKPCSTQLDYYSTFEPICQHIFQKFFTFVALHYLTNFDTPKWLLCTKSLQKIQVSASFTPRKP